MTSYDRFRGHSTQRWDEETNELDWEFDWDRNLLSFSEPATKWDAQDALSMIADRFPVLGVGYAYLQLGKKQSARSWRVHRVPTEAQATLFASKWLGVAPADLVMYEDEDRAGRLGWLVYAPVPRKEIIHMRPPYEKAKITLVPHAWNR